MSKPAASVPSVSLVPVLLGVLGGRLRRNRGQPAPVAAAEPVLAGMR